MKQKIFRFIAIITPFIILIAFEICFRLSIHFSHKELISYPSIIAARFNKNAGIPGVTDEGFLRYSSTKDKMRAFVIGDSVPASYAKTRQNFPAFLSRIMSATVDNFSISGSNLDHYEYILDNYIGERMTLGYYQSV